MKCFERETIAAKSQHLSYSDMKSELVGLWKTIVENWSKATVKIHCGRLKGIISTCNQCVFQLYLNNVYFFCQCLLTPRKRAAWQELPFACSANLCLGGCDHDGGGVARVSPEMHLTASSTLQATTAQEGSSVIPAVTFIQHGSRIPFLSLHQPPPLSNLCLPYRASCRKAL